jgi:F-type H+-transporting ATPase subunit epsilon
MAHSLRIVLVTPETTLLDEPVQSLRFPLFDGQFGVLPGRAPLVGRLGAGELRIMAPSGTRSYFIAGGFVQVKGPVVSLLTHRAIPADDLDPQAAQRELDAALARKTTTEFEFTARQAEILSARRKLALARRAT